MSGTEKGLNCIWNGVRDPKQSPSPGTSFMGQYPPTPGNKIGPQN